MQGWQACCCGRHRHRHRRRRRRRRRHTHTSPNYGVSGSAVPMRCQIESSLDYLGFPTPSWTAHMLQGKPIEVAPVLAAVQQAFCAQLLGHPVANDAGLPRPAIGGFRSRRRYAWMSKGFTLRKCNRKRANQGARQTTTSRVVAMNPLFVLWISLAWWSGAERASAATTPGAFPRQRSLQGAAAKHSEFVYNLRDAYLATMRLSLTG